MIDVYVHTHVHVKEGTRVPVHRWTLKDNLVIWSSSFNLTENRVSSLFTTVFNESRVCGFQKHPWISFYHRRTRITCIQYFIQLYMGLGDSNSSPQESKAKLYPLSISPAHNILLFIQLVLKSTAWWQLKKTVHLAKMTETTQLTLVHTAIKGHYLPKVHKN